MADGSFEGLYTFQEVANIYGIDNSTLRKRIVKNKFVNEVEVKKFGKTWLITEQAMIKYFGSEKFDLYKNKIKK
ncbi:helix-turn-helix domain-containing protein [Paraclostridium bifermentans]|uniref:helix-turn-helix domain-containing protein n=1 Tax=Paraclostridium bifermentans TaxID=1490 RepID=UPI00359CA223